MIGSVVMLDFSRAENSKNHRLSYMKASNTLIEIMEQFQKEYNAIWEKLEIQRKERAAIIEETIQLLKNNKVKLTKQLGRCDNHEINKEVLEIINALPDEERETIQINLVRINNRYERICKLGKKLEELNDALSNYRIMEADYEDEVEIVIPSKNKDKVEETKPNQPKEEPPKEEIEEVVSRKEASSELISSLDQTLEAKERHDNSMKSTLIEDDDIRYKRKDDLEDTNELSSIEDEINYITETDDEEKINEYLNSQVEEEPKDDEYVLFTINEMTTLKEIAQNVYQNEKLWKYIYTYGHNKGKIDRKASQYDVDAETIASEPGYLKNVTLEFPTILVTQEEIEQNEDNIVEFPSRSAKSGRRVA